MKMVATWFAILITAIVYGQTTSDSHHECSDSFDSFRANIRVLDEPTNQACETRLHQILRSLDVGPSCAVDTECTLRNQDPFGGTVPVHVSQANALLADMKQFAEVCDNHALRSIQNNETVSFPSCVESRCMVSTSLGPLH